MIIDVVLPSMLCLITVATVLLHFRFQNRIKSLFQESEFRVRDAAFMVTSMGVMVTIMAFVPQQAIQILFLAAYSFILFLFIYVAVEKWYVAVLPSAAFVYLYLYWWNLVLLNIFAITFAILVSLYLGGLFSWKTVAVFAVLVTVMDVVQVFGTGYMGASAEKMLQLQLPTLIIVPAFPAALKGYLGLGLGDVFLAGLLCIQTAQKHGRKTGISAAASIGIVFFLFEIISLNYPLGRYFPATVIVVGGWLTGLGFHHLLKFNRKQSS